MTFEVNNGIATGLLVFLQDAKIPEAFLTYLSLDLYNLHSIIWYDFEQNIVLVRMRGSIISMMQFRKIIQTYYPNMVDE